MTTGAQGRPDHRQGVYGPSTVKRGRSTKAEIEALDAGLVELIRPEKPVTVRGAFYRAVAAGLVPKTENGYRLVGRELVKLRRAGTIPYGWLVDGTRLIRKPASHSRLDTMLENAAASYRRALWEDQGAEVMVLSEKDAISGVVYPVTSRWDVPLGIVRGYSSVTFAYEIAEDIRDAEVPVYIYNLGDHDPSGVDAWRSFEATVRGFRLGGMAVFERLAVTPEQIEQYNLPTRPTKGSDSRAGGFAGESVEVDALPPTVLRQLVEERITEHIDPEALRLTRAVERSERDLLYEMAGQIVYEDETP